MLAALLVGGWSGTASPEDYTYEHAYLGYVRPFTYVDDAGVLAICTPERPQIVLRALPFERDGRYYFLQVLTVSAEFPSACPTGIGAYAVIRDQTPRTVEEWAYVPEAQNYDRNAAGRRVTVKVALEVPFYDAMQAVSPSASARHLRPLGLLGTQAVVYRDVGGGPVLSTRSCTEARYAVLTLVQPATPVGPARPHAAERVVHDPIPCLE